MNITDKTNEAVCIPAVWPLSVMAGCAWNVLDARGVRVACCKFGDGLDAEVRGAEIAARVVAEANAGHTLCTDPAKPAVVFEQVMLWQLFSGKMTTSMCETWCIPAEDIHGDTVCATLADAYRGVLEHCKRERGGGAVQKQEGTKP